MDKQICSRPETQAFDDIFQMGYFSILQTHLIHFRIIGARRNFDQFVDVIESLLNATTCWDC